MSRLKGKDDGYSSMGKTKGPTRHSRWTFWQAGYGERKPLICNICKEIIYKLKVITVNDNLISTCDKCNKKDTIYDYLKNKSNREST